MFGNTDIAFFVCISAPSMGLEKTNKVPETDTLLEIGK